MRNLIRLFNKNFLKNHISIHIYYLFKSLTLCFNNSEYLLFSEVEESLRWKLIVTLLKSVDLGLFFSASFFFDVLERRFEGTGMRSRFIVSNSLFDVLERRFEGTGMRSRFIVSNSLF